MDSLYISDHTDILNHKVSLYFQFYAGATLVISGGAPYWSGIKSWTMLTCGGGWVGGGTQVCHTFPRYIRVCDLSVTVNIELLLRYVACVSCNFR